MDTTTIEGEVNLVIAESRDMVIASDEGLEIAGAFLRRIKTILKSIDSTFNESIKAAHDTHKKMIAAKKEHSEPLLKAEVVVKQGIATYGAEQRKLREAEELRLREVARKEEEDRRLAEAEQLEAEGRTEEAEEVIEAPIETVPVVLQKETKVAGISTRQVWKWRLTDQSKVPAGYLMVDEKKLNKVVYAMGRQSNIPGIEVYPHNVVSARVA